MKLFIRVINWEKYQHEAVTHKGGRPRADGSQARPSSPSFFAVYVNLWRQHEFDRLPDRDKLALFTIWMLATIHGNEKVYADAAWIRKEGCIEGDIHLGALVDAGFIELITEDGERVTELPATAWGQPLDVIDAAEHLASPQRPGLGARFTRDVEIIRGEPPLQDPPNQAVGLVMETNPKPIPEVSAHNREEDTRAEEPIDIQGQSSVVDAARDDLQIIIKALPDDTKEEILRLARAIPRGAASMGRFVNLARAGATARMFADARQAYQVTNTRKANPGAWVCEVIEENMRKGAA